MSKKVLIISSSPRKGGNSDILCDEFAKGAAESGSHVEKIFLGSQKIGYCLGCGVCNTTSKCVQKDDMTALLEKMVSADVILLATPVYFYTMSAQMKTFIDRTVPRYTEITGKEFYYIVAAADTEVSSMEKTIESFRGFTIDCLEGTVEKGIIYGVGAWNKGEINSTPAIKEAYEMGKAV
ncbi:flavodoxin family protein [Anaerobium acetethylicum]|uniref:NADPH-dependent FMN reductase n=1 Tax=Anaerobium acetethylicum TaxID=1619234 RepID=A0A1D3TVG4_9FIRM|nr:flavodoxin family protein [Anaerobium acetethylicum]SCP98136.1 NADPH-dependent FMN reductase [Anaerobium acetethylicum]